MIKLLLMLIMSIGLGVANQTVENVSFPEVQSFFQENLEEIRTEYYDSFGESWDVSSIENIKGLYALDDSHIGYLVDFNCGYIAYGLDMAMYDMTNVGQPAFANSDERLYYEAGSFMEKTANDFYTEDGSLYNPEIIMGKGMFAGEIYYPLSNQLNYSGFRINGSCTKIPVLKDKYNSSSWGNYKAVSFYQGAYSDCGVIAIMNLLHTYKLSGCANYVNPSHNPTSMRQELRGLTNWQGNIAGEGMLPMDLTRGGTNYINKSNVRLASASANDNIPMIGFYSSLNIANTAHFAMRIGSAQQDYWWIFKTYWDIIVTWKSNYFVNTYEGNPVGLMNTYSCYYLVDQQYRQSTFKLYE